MNVSFVLNVYKISSILFILYNEMLDLLILYLFVIKRKRYISFSNFEKI